MALKKYANNISTTLNGAITNVATTITLTSATGLPAIGASEVYRLTIDDGTNIEVVEVTDDASSPTLTVTRGVDGTSGTAFADGTQVELRVTADSFEDALAADTSPELRGDLDVAGNSIVDSTGDCALEPTSGQVAVNKSAAGSLRAFDVDGGTNVYAGYFTSSVSASGAYVGVVNNASVSTSNLAGMEFRLNSSTQERQAGTFQVKFSTTTDASRTSTFVMNTIENATQVSPVILEGNSVLIGGTGSPGATLDVNGDIETNTWAKVGSYTVAGVPSASTAGAGAIIYVSNETGGAVLAFSDGTNWRRVTDRAVVS